MQKLEHLREKCLPDLVHLHARISDETSQAVLNAGPLREALAVQCDLFDHPLQHRTLL